MIKSIQAALAKVKVNLDEEDAPLPPVRFTNDSPVERTDRGTMHRRVAVRRRDWALPAAIVLALAVGIGLMALAVTIVNTLR